MKRRLFLLIILPFLVVGCGPSPEEIATQTAAAWTATPTQTNTPMPTPVPPTATPTVKASTTPIPLALSPEAMLETALAAMAEVETYHFEMIMQISMTSGGITIDIPISYIGDAKAPDRQQGILNMEAFGISIEQEVIIIGETAYTKDPETGQWEMGTVADAVPFTPDTFVGTDTVEMDELVLIGEEDIEGIPVYHLKGTASNQALGLASGEAEGVLQADYLIGFEDWRIRQIAIEMELFEEGGDPERMNFTATMTFSDFNREVVIEAP